MMGCVKEWRRYVCGWRVGGGGGGTGVEEKGWLFYSDTGLTAAWQWRPRHCLLGTKPVTQDKSTNQDWSWFRPEEWGWQFCSH